MPENIPNNDERLIFTHTETKKNARQKNKKTENLASQIRLPIFTAIALGVGLILGGGFFSGQNINSSFTIGRWSAIQTEESASDQAKKLRQVLTYIEDYYVDTVNMSELTDIAIQEMLKKLDPHTSYIPAKDVALINSQLEGDFEGIGIEFMIHQDTIQIIMPLPGSPAEKAGLEAADRIIKVGDKPVAGVKLDGKEVFDLLRGKKNSEVQLTIYRPYQNKTFQTTVTRGVIPTQTVEAAYLLEPTTGYIKISRFGANTYNEFEVALNKLLRKGMQNLVLDLRGNPGGYMEQAVKIVDEVLSGEKMIVYTDGKGKRFDSEDKARRKGRFEDGAMVVLIDEGSASASEIVAGALQDNDRAWIVGRRSFGKGLVQKPLRLRDGSELRMTISRYYTPSGRCIQKPYSDTTDYSLEIMERYTNGELYHTDSSKVDTLRQYKTLHGRLVFGGGGIMPDTFVPKDTSFYTPALDTLFKYNLLRTWATLYFHQHKETLKIHNATYFIENFDITPALEKQFLNFVEQQNVQINDVDYNQSRNYIKTYLKSHIGKLLWQNEALYPILNQYDTEIKVALEQLVQAKALQTYFEQEE